MGLADEFEQFPAAPSNIRTKNFGSFFQDEWKVRSNLTLTLGLRYEYNTPKLDTQNRTFSWGIPGAKSAIFPNAPAGLLFPGDALAPKGSNYPDKNDFAPRFGFAWSPTKDPRFAIRGGGVFYDILPGNYDESDFRAPEFCGAIRSGEPAQPVSGKPPNLESRFRKGGLSAVRRRRRIFGQSAYSYAPKVVAVRKSLKLEYRADFFNMLNHAQFNTPSTTITSSLFGQISGTASPRIIQMALRLQF